MGKKKARRTVFSGADTDRIIIRGVHPEDIRSPKKQYEFIASDFLITEFPCVGDLVRVHTKTKKTLLYVTDIRKWKEGDFVPQKIARAIYQGEKWADFEYETDK